MPLFSLIISFTLCTFYLGWMLCLFSFVSAHSSFEEHEAVKTKLKKYPHIGIETKRLDIHSNPRYRRRTYCVDQVKWHHLCTPLLQCKFKDVIFLLPTIQFTSISPNAQVQNIASTICFWQRNVHYEMFSSRIVWCMLWRQKYNESISSKPERGGGFTNYLTVILIC